VQITRTIIEQNRFEVKAELQKQAYLGWIIYLLQPTAEKRGKLSLKQWMKNLGLSDEEKESTEDLKNLKIKALEVAKKIIKMDKKVR